MTDKEAWVRFACQAYARHPQMTPSMSAKRADELLAELKKRALDGGVVPRLQFDTPYDTSLEPMSDCIATVIPGTARINKP